MSFSVQTDTLKHWNNLSNRLHLSQTYGYTSQNMQLGVKITLMINCDTKKLYMSRTHAMFKKNVFFFWTFDWNKTLPVLKFKYSARKKINEVNRWILITFYYPRTSHEKDLLFFPSLLHVFVLKFFFTQQFEEAPIDIRQLPQLVQQTLTLLPFKSTGSWETKRMNARLRLLSF